MKLAVVGSRKIDSSFVYEYLSENISDNIKEIVTGGAKGTDSVAMDYAKQNGIKLTLFLPEYNIYKKGAPLKRNKQIAQYADFAFIFWDGISNGTEHIIRCFEQLSKPFTLIYTRPL